MSCIADVTNLLGAAEAPKSWDCQAGPPCTVSGSVRSSAVRSVVVRYAPRSVQSRSKPHRSAPLLSALSLLFFLPRSLTHLPCSRCLAYNRIGRSNEYSRFLSLCQDRMDPSKMIYIGLFYGNNTSQSHLICCFHRFPKLPSKASYIFDAYNVFSTR